MERFRNPVVISQPKEEAGVGDDVKVGDVVNGDTVIATTDKRVSICYSKRHNTCNECNRISCPFSGA